MPRFAVPAAAAVILAGGLVACTGSTGPSAQQKAAQAFLNAVGRTDAATAAKLTDNETAARSTLAASFAGLGRGAKGSLKLGKITRASGRTAAAYTASWSVPGATGKWTYTGSVPLAKQQGTWQVVWRPSDLQPGLQADEHLQAKRTPAPRAALEDSAGRPLLTPTPVVAVGIEPKLVTDLPKLAATLAGISELQSTAAEITSAVKAARPTDFVPIITLRRPVYEQLKPQIYNLDGTVFQSSTMLLPPTARFAEPLLGTVGPATAAIIAKSGGRIAAGDQTGLGGLEQAYDATLAGRPGVTVLAVPDSGDAAPRVLATVAKPTPGTPVKLTLDRSVQTAADAALAGVKQAASIVVVSRSTGHILADADSAATTYDYGLAGAFPPGSTFKIATWTAAFLTDPSLTPDSIVDCPGTITVDGRQFVNENKFSHPPIPISAAFGYSCNTSAIAEALKLPTAALGAAARQLGLGAKWSLPVSAFPGSMPAPATQTERAADAIGQGRVLVSPLLMALMVGAAATGTVNAPQLVAAPATPTKLPAALVAKLNTLLKAPIQLPGGTAHQLDALGGVEGKTGTAEYGTATPPRSHTWFVGTKGDLAFAVFVYDGASQDVDGADIAKTFLLAR